MRCIHLLGDRYDDGCGRGRELVLTGLVRSRGGGQLRRKRGPRNPQGGSLRPVPGRLLPDRPHGVHGFTGPPCGVPDGSGFRHENLGTGQYAGTVPILGTHNATGEVVLDFGIYHGITVYVTRDGSGNTYQDGERKLSSFGPSTGTLFDLGNVVPGQFQYAEMYVDNHSEYVGMDLGILVRDTTGVDGLYSGIELMVQSGGTLRKMTLEEASQGITVLGTVSSAEDIGVTVTMIVPEGLGGNGVQGAELGFMLVLCVMSHNTGGQ